MIRTVNDAHQIRRGSPKEYRAYLRNTEVTARRPVIVYGSVRGLVSEHRSLVAAARSLRKDQRGCRNQGGLQ